MRGGTVPLARLCVIPLLFTLWGLHGVVSIFGGSPPSILARVLAFALGAMAGLWRARRTWLRADKQRGVIALPGSAATLVLVRLTFRGQIHGGRSAGHRPRDTWGTLIPAARFRRDGLCRGHVRRPAVRLWRQCQAAPHEALAAA